MPGEIFLDMTGDVVTEDLGRILASVCQNDLEPIKRMIEDPAVNEHVHSACLRSLLILVLEEELPRMEDVHQTLAEGKEVVLRKHRERRDGFIEDAIAEMQWWACFKQDRAPSTPKRSTAAHQPIVKVKKVGCNDPCPCGSGKKHKKCCLH